MIYVVGIACVVGAWAVLRVVGGERQARLKELRRRIAAEGAEARGADQP
jgi:hypothetical protein